MKKKEKILWTLTDVRAGDIKPNPQNPKIKNAKGTKRLHTLIERFGLVYDGIANKDLRLIDGHRRLDLNEDPDKILKIFTPSRQLTTKEYEEMNAMFDIARAGEPDYTMIEEKFDDTFFEDYDLEKKQKPLIARKELLQPYRRTHILISFPPEKFPQLQALLQKITNFSFVEYEQATN